jgi:hypothetical protein
MSTNDKDVPVEVSKTKARGGVTGPQCALRPRLRARRGCCRLHGPRHLLWIGRQAKHSTRLRDDTYGLAGCSRRRAMTSHA